MLSRGPIVALNDEPNKNILLLTKEYQRLNENNSFKAHWRRWGPYLSERQWGTVRQDNSTDGTASS